MELAIMKIYKDDLNKLYEAEGFGIMTIGKTYLTKKGSKITIDDIYIDANSLVPDVYVKYTFESPDAKKGTEKNRFTVLVDMIRNS
jgi:hypothetical protein